MFVDKASVHIKAGDGGNGVVSFRHEKFVDKGGPDGGDGGDGGDVFLLGSKNQNTLASFRHAQTLAATSGGSGAKRKQHGKNGDDLEVLVPVGTVATNESGQTIADITEDGQKVKVVHGGKGGFGNAHFKSSRRQVPRIAEKGEPGEELTITLELKLIAEVGLVGLPNAGKSTFLARVSNARPEIADYPFTTLTPNLGVVDIADRSLIIADIPGLIEGASKGKGLGDEFLRHVERTQVLLHLIDVYNESLEDAYNTIQQELNDYSSSLGSKPQIVALTKTEGFDKELLEDRLASVKAVVPKGVTVTAISSNEGSGINELLQILAETVAKESALQAKAEDEATTSDDIPVLKLADEQPWQVEKQGKVFKVRGEKIERFAQRTNFGDFHAEQRLRDIMKKMGITHELKRQHIEPGDTIQFGEAGKLEY